MQRLAIDASKLHLERIIRPGEEKNYPTINKNVFNPDALGPNLD